MHLYKMPRYKDTLPHEVEIIQAYLRWLETPDEIKYQCSYNYYKDEPLPSQDKIDFYKNYYIMRYPDWDDYQINGYKAILAEVGYWRNNRNIHDWFVNNNQDGIYDCRMHREVTEDDLHLLINYIDNEISRTSLRSGKIRPMKNGKLVQFDSFLVEDELGLEYKLPTNNCFYWGQEYYDEEDMERWVYSKEVCEKALRAVDFEKEMLAYRPSW